MTAEWQKRDHLLIRKFVVLRALDYPVEDQSPAVSFSMKYKNNVINHVITIIVSVDSRFENKYVLIERFFPVKNFFHLQRHSYTGPEIVDLAEPAFLQRVHIGDRILYSPTRNAADLRNFGALEEKRSYLDCSRLETKVNGVNPVSNVTLLSTPLLGSLR